MKFKYTALGLDSQKLTGTLEADSLEMAREKLHKMGTSIISIEEAPDETPVEEVKVAEETPNSQAKPIEKKEENIETYYFEAKDSTDKLINGTIDAKDAFSAYKRLISEYQFIVQELKKGQDSSSSESLQSEFSTWNQLLTEEGFDLNPFSNKDEEDDEGRLAEEVVEEIDRFVVSTKKILDTHKDQYNKDFLKEIESKLANLERIRSSTNLNHITKVCNDLYRLISHPTLLKTEEDDLSPTEKRTDDYKEILENLKTSGFVENKFKFLDKYKQKKSKARFGKLQTIFSSIQSKLTNTQKKSTQQRLKEIKKAEERMNASNGMNLVSLKPVIFSFFAYLFESNKILRRIKKQEFDEAYKQWKTQRNQSKQSQLEKQVDSSTDEKRDFTAFFLEVDSFVGWLLFFYVSFFFLVSFSLERNLGLSQSLILKVLSEPHIINISIFLVLIHLTLKLKIRLFRQNFFGTAFLLFFSLGLYTLIISNF